MEQQLLAGLLQRGISLPVAQGMVANMIAESGLNPGVNEINPTVAGSRGGYGLNQWTGPRRRQYEAFAAQNGADPADPNTQLDFTLWEFNNTEKGAWSALQGAPDAATAARIYSEKFLRPGIPNMDRRVSEAERMAGTPQTNSLGAAQQPQQGNALAQVQQPRFKTTQIDPRAFMTTPNQLSLLRISRG